MGGGEEDGGNDSSEYRAGAKTPTNSKQKSDRKKLAKKHKSKGKKTKA